MTDASPKRRKRTGDLHVRVGDEGLAAIDKLAEEDKRTRSDMARVLLGEAVAARLKGRAR